MFDVCELRSSAADESGRMTMVFQMGESKKKIEKERERTHHHIEFDTTMQLSITAEDDNMLCHFMSF